MSQLICSKKIHFYFLFYTFYSENVKKSQKVVFCQIFRSTWFRSLCSDQITRSDHWLEKSDLDQIKSDLDHWSDLKKIRSTILCSAKSDLKKIRMKKRVFFSNQTLLNRVSSACEGFNQKICNKLVVTFMRGFFSL